MNHSANKGRFRWALAAAVMWVLVWSPVWAAAFGDFPSVAPKPDEVRTARLPAAFAKAAPESIAELREMQQHVEGLAKRLADCTVGVQIGNAQGSGVIVSEDGYVLTAAHVAGAPGRRVRILLTNGRQVEGKSLGLDRSTDAALLKITEQGSWPFASPAESDEVEAGDWCLVLGHPGGFQRNRGPVARLGRVVSRQPSLVQTDCELVGGDSGGPLFDMHGRVIGIHSRIGASLVWNFHVPIGAYNASWERLVAGEAWGGGQFVSQAILGVRGEDIERGCRITSIGPGLPAEQAGLRVGDVIVAFDGSKIVGFGDLIEAVGKKRPGDEVQLVLLRGDERLEKTIILAQR